MNKRVLGSLAAVVACLCLLGLRYELRARAAQAGALPELLNLAPANASFIAYADLSALRQAPLLQRATELAKPPTPDGDYTKFEQATGFDYQKDLDRILIANQSGLSPAAGA